MTASETDVQLETARATQAYLAEHFCTADDFAAIWGGTLGQLSEFKEAGIVPAPSYGASNGKLHSVAFGELDGRGILPGHYYRKMSADWFLRAIQLKGPIERAAQNFEREFRKGLSEELLKAHRALHPLPDAFDEDGAPIEGGLNKRIDAMLNAHRSGVFSICVARPDWVAVIVRKEILQEKLVDLTQDGAALPKDYPLDDLANLIDAYEKVSMPFTPLEYPISSRKRLVDDLWVKIAESR